MMYTERAEMTAVSCGSSHASAVSTPSVVFCFVLFFCFLRYKNLVTHVESHASEVSLLESRE